MATNISIFSFGGGGIFITLVTFSNHVVSFKVVGLSRHWWRQSCPCD